MDPVMLTLTAVNTALRIFEVVLEDIPKERRMQAWEDWYRFWDPILAPLRKP